MPKDTWKVSMGVFGPQGKLLPKLTFINWSPNRQVVHYMTEMYLTQGWVDDLFEVTLPAQIAIERMEELS